MSYQLNFDFILKNKNSEMKFSQRLGINPIEKPLQIESMDSDLRNGLWNIYKMWIIEKLGSTMSYHYASDAKPFFIWIYHNYFKSDIDQVPNDFFNASYKIKNFFLYNCKWYEVFDIMEASIKAIEITSHSYGINVQEFQHYINRILEREFSAYRFINGIIAPITNDTEFKEIEKATLSTKQFTAFLGSNAHLTEALKILSDRKTTDYRNSIKESISAIESLTKAISGKNSDTLGSALTKVKDKIGLHTALERGFKQLYGYTSDADGIRHGLMDEPNCDFDDAKYMLVSSSAFINYLIAKATKAGINFV